METEELTRLVDEIYKNILDKFNPGARQLINAGKAYLKALHGAAAASRVYVDALSRLARQAQLGTWGGSKDVGFALMRIVEVYKEIQDQEMNILKAFYVDLLVPLETNLEKDTKVVQSEQKKFLQQHKTRSETYSKAAATMKKQRKKSRAANKSGLAMDKELKNMQILEEEKTKLDAFCEQSLKNAMTQERRRYGFVLERQCSLAKHYASFHEVALAALHPSVDKWREVAATREYLPQSVEDMFASRLRQTSFWPEDEENGGSELTTMSSQLRKTRSMDSSCLELRLGPLPGNPQSSGGHLGPTPHLPAVLSRARSEANLHASTLSLGPEVPETPPRPRSMAPPASRSSGAGTGIGAGGWGDAPLARALFAYLSSGENQLSFLEGDLIALMGDRQKGWQFGENLRTQSSGWFPLAYTEIIIDDILGSPSHGASNGRTPDLQAIPPCKPPPSRPPVTPAGIDESSGGTTGANSNSANSNNANNNNNNNGSCVGTPTNNASVLATPTARQSKSVRPSGTLPAVLAGGRRVQPPVPPVPPPAMTSLHSSNDSGFSNEPPVQPDVDYSDDEALRFYEPKLLDAATKVKICCSDSLFVRYKTQIAMLNNKKLRESREDTLAQQETSLLSWLRTVAPIFPVNGSKITIIHKPQMFYTTLLEKCKRAKKRITFASLYLGTGPLETELVNVIEKAMNTSEGNLQVRILLDYMRGSRGKQNSRKMLEPLLKGKYGDRCKVFLYHTPKLRGVMKATIPDRFNELIGLQHMKLYIIDDDLIISGANLSNDYFTNRQDRYFVIEDCAELCDFYNKLIERVMEFSFLLQSDGNTDLNSAVNCIHPLKGSRKTFIQEVASRIQMLFRDEMEKRASLDKEDADTWIFPMVQMGQLDVYHDSAITLKLIQTAPIGATLRLATGYFNLTFDYSQALLRDCQATCHLLTAHPTANGFFNAKGIAGGIPAAYTKIEESFYDLCEKMDQHNRITLWEFIKPGWTYHAKGLWYTLPDQRKPSLTLIGSSNFGYRSVNRDLETQIAVVTKNNKLQDALHEEQAQLFSCAKPATRKTFLQQDRVPPAWVCAVVLFFRYYF